MAEPATFYALFDRITPGTNKYMATLWNGATGRKVTLLRMWMFNWQTAAVTGINLDQYIARITARTKGTDVPVWSHDTADGLTTGIECDTNSTGVTEHHIFRRFLHTNEEGSGLGAQLGEDFLMAKSTYQLLWEKKSDLKGLVLRLGQGASIRNITALTTQNCSYLMAFTDEPA